MRKQIFCLITGLIFTMVLPGARELHQVFKPAQLLVTPEKTILVFDRAAGLMVFQSGDAKPVKIGGFGQGPGEYGKSAFLSVWKEKIHLSTWSKMVVYDFQGKVVRELRHNLDLFRHRLIPLPDSGWLADLAETDYSPHGGTIIRVCLLNSDFTIREELYRRKIPLPMREVRLFPFATGSLLMGNRIVTAAAEDNGALRIFALKGKSMGAVVLPQSQWRRPTKDEIDARMEAYRKRAGDPAFWKELKKRITIPNHIPNILDFRVAKEGILVHTPNLRDDKRVFLLFNFSGTLIKEFLLPDAGPLYDFSNGTYHYLETPDEDNPRIISLNLP